MIDESKVAATGALSPRAGVALLTLQLRSTLQEAIDAEAEVASVDVDAALWQLRSRLGPLMEDRRKALADDLVAEQERADEAVAAARDEAAQIVADARDRADAAVEQAARAEAAQRAAAALAERRAAIAAALAVTAESPVTEPPDIEPPVADAGGDDATPGSDAPVLEFTVDETPVIDKPDVFDDPLLDWYPKLAPATLPPPSQPPLEALASIIETNSDAPLTLTPPIAASIVLPAIDTPADDSGWASEPAAPASTLRLPVVVTETPAGSSDPRAMHVVIDADSFARAFAAALAPVLDARNQAPGYGPYPPQAYMPAPAPTSKRSFWAHAWHPDVLLSGLAMVIVIIVLVAWTG